MKVEGAFYCNVEMIGAIIADRIQKTPTIYIDSTAIGG